MRNVKYLTLAETLMESEQFPRVVDARKLLNRFSILVEKHRRFDAASAKLSGVDQEETEKHILLDFDVFVEGME